MCGVERCWPFLTVFQYYRFFEALIPKKGPKPIHLAVSETFLRLIVILGCWQYICGHIDIALKLSIF